MKNFIVEFPTLEIFYGKVQRLPNESLNVTENHNDKYTLRIRSNWTPRNFNINIKSGEKLVTNEPV